MVDIELFKTHARIDDSFDDDYITVILNAAIGHVSKMTGVANDEAASEDYQLAVMLLALHFYSNREIISDRGALKVPYGYEFLIQNLKTDGFF